MRGGKSRATEIGKRNFKHLDELDDDDDDLNFGRKANDSEESYSIDPSVQLWKSIDFAKARTRFESKETNKYDSKSIEKVNISKTRNVQYKFDREEAAQNSILDQQESGQIILNSPIKNKIIDSKDGQKQNYTRMNVQTLVGSNHSLLNLSPQGNNLSNQKIGNGSLYQKKSLSKFHSHSSDNHIDCISLANPNSSSHDFKTAFDYMKKQNEVLKNRLVKTEQEANEILDIVTPYEFEFSSHQLFSPSSLAQPSKPMAFPSSPQHQQLKKPTTKPLQQNPEVIEKQFDPIQPFTPDNGDSILSMKQFIEQEKLELLSKLEHTEQKLQTLIVRTEQDQQFQQQKIHLIESERVELINQIQLIESSPTPVSTPLSIPSSTSHTEPVLRPFSSPSSVSSPRLEKESENLTSTTTPSPTTAQSLHERLLSLEKEKDNFILRSNQLIQSNQEKISMVHDQFQQEKQQLIETFEQMQSERDILTNQLQEQEKINSIQIAKIQQDFQQEKKIIQDSIHQIEHEKRMITQSLFEKETLIGCYLQQQQQIQVQQDEVGKKEEQTVKNHEIKSSSTSSLDVSPTTHSLTSPTISPTLSSLSSSSLLALTHDPAPPISLPSQTVQTSPSTSTPTSSLTTSASFITNSLIEKLDEERIELQHFFEKMNQEKEALANKLKLVEELDSKREQKIHEKLIKEKENLKNVVAKMKEELQFEREKEQQQQLLKHPSVSNSFLGRTSSSSSNSAHHLKINSHSQSNFHSNVITENGRGGSALGVLTPSVSLFELMESSPLPSSSSSSSSSSITSTSSFAVGGGGGGVNKQIIGAIQEGDEIEAGSPSSSSFSSGVSNLLESTKNENSLNIGKKDLEHENQKEEGDEQETLIDIFSDAFGDFQHVADVDLNEDEHGAEEEDDEDMSMFSNLPAPHAAAARGDLERLKFFETKEPSLLLSLDESRRSPLFYAVAYSQIECAQYLLYVMRINETLSLGQVDIHGDSFLHAATSTGNVNCLQILIEACVEFSAKNASSSSTGKVDHEINSKNSNSNSSHLIAENSSTTPSPPSLQRIDPWQFVNIKNNMGMTPAHLANSVDCLEQLYLHGADLSVRDLNGRSPLFVACAMNRDKCAQYLMTCLDEDETSLVISDSRGDNPLHAAACNGSVDCLLLLLQYGIDPLLRNQKGFLAIDLAVKNRHKKCRDLLAEYHLHYCTSSDFDSMLFLATLEGHRQVKQFAQLNTIPSIGNQLNHEAEYSIIKKPSNLTAGLASPVGSEELKKTESLFSLKAKKSLRLQRLGSWIAYEDQQTNHIYYFHPTTHKGQWTIPESVQKFQTKTQEKGEKSLLASKMSMRMRRIGDWIQYQTQPKKSTGHKPYLVNEENELNERDEGEDESQTFYYNEKTGEFQWISPEIEGESSSSTTSSSSSSSSSPSSSSRSSNSFKDWKAYQDPETNSLFWYNHVTKLSQWEMPACVSEQQRRHLSNNSQNSPQKGDDEVFKVENNEDLGI